MAHAAKAPLMPIAGEEGIANGPYVGSCGVLACEREQVGGEPPFDAHVEDADIPRPMRLVRDARK